MNEINTLIAAIDVDCDALTTAYQAEQWEEGQRICKRMMSALARLYGLALVKHSEKMHG